jgi:hypothetical protein
MAAKNKDLANSLISRKEALDQIRRDYEDLWLDIIDFVNIRRYNLKDDKQRGQKTGTKLYSTEAIDALRDLRSGLFGYLVSPAMQWFRLRVGDEFLMADRGVKAWLEAVEWAIYTALQRANFYETMPEVFNDGGSIGTATLYDEEDVSKGNLVFTACNPGEIWIAEDKYGRVDTIFRRTKFTARQAVDKFCDITDNMSMTDRVKMALEAGLSDSLVRSYQDPSSVETEYAFLHAVIPNKDVETFYNPISGHVEPKLKPTNKPFQSYYVQEDGPSVVSESGYWSNPFQVWRWRKNSEEIYGRSPSADAIVDILTDNQMGRTLLNAAHMAVEPAFNVPAELKGKVRITPRGMNYYEDAGRIITPVLAHGANYPIGVDREDRTKKAIKRHFMTEFFTLLSQAAFEGRQLSVPQVMEMQSEKAVMLGDIVGQINSELLDPLVDRVFQIEYTAGRIPPPPDILSAMEGSRIEVHYMGPLAQAQRRLFKTQGITQGLAMMEVVSTRHPEVDDNVDYDIVAREILEVNGFPVRALRDEGRRDAMRQDRLQQAQAEKQMAMAAQMSQAVPNISKAPEEGSLMSKMVEGEE